MREREIDRESKCYKLRPLDLQYISFHQSRDCFRSNVSYEFGQSELCECMIAVQFQSLSVVQFCLRHLLQLIVSIAKIRMSYGIVRFQLHLEKNK